jgi:hypothetical protein
VSLLRPNLIKLHKTQPASNRIARRWPLMLHTAAYWLVLAMRAAIPTVHALARAEFTTHRLRRLKLAARISETATRVRIAFAAVWPEAVLFRRLAGALCCRPP